MVVLFSFFQFIIFSMQTYKLLIFALLALTLTVCSSTESSTFNLNSSYQCEDTDKLMQQVLELINEARSENRSCGGQFFSATTPLTWNNKLFQAAAIHSEDMSTNDFFSHTGSNGLQVSARISNAGYNWRAVAENIYAGAPDTLTAVNGWLNSAGHCKNIMNPVYKEMGVACSRVTSSTYGTYHTQVFATEQ